MAILVLLALVLATAYAWTHPKVMPEERAACDCNLYLIKPTLGCRRPGCETAPRKKSERIA